MLCSVDVLMSISSGLSRQSPLPVEQSQLSDVRLDDLSVFVSASLQRNGLVVFLQVALTRQWTSSGQSLKVTRAS